MSKPRTLIDLLEDRAVHDPDSDAFVFRDVACSYKTLWESVCAVSAALLADDLEQGARVVVALPNGPEFFSAFYGVQRAGGIPVPTFPGSGDDYLGRLARRCGATTVIVSEEAASRNVSPGSFQTIEWLLHHPAAGDGRQLPHLNGDDLAYIQYTSGTTGEPKGVQLSHANVLVNIRQLTAGFEITPEDVFISWLPAHHDMGLVLMTMVPFALGARLILLPASLHSLQPWLAGIARHRATFTASPDFGYRMALRLRRENESFDLSSLRVALNAAEPVRAATIEAFESAFGLESVVIAGYGLAEATVGVAASKPGSRPRTDADGTVAVGHPFPEVEIAIQRMEERVGPGELGEILVRSPANTRGYWGVDDPGSLLADDGFLHTGDLGYLDGEGHLFVVGRLKEMILQAGRNIAPREVEEIVDELAFVRRSAAIGYDRGDAAGEQLYLFVEVNERSRPDEETCRERVVTIVECIRSHLGIRPGRVYLIAPRTIPFTANGKVRYIELKEAYRLAHLKRDGKLWYPEW